MELNFDIDRYLDLYKEKQSVSRKLEDLSQQIHRCQDLVFKCMNNADYIKRGIAESRAQKLNNMMFNRIDLRNKINGYSYSEREWLIITEKEFAWFEKIAVENEYIFALYDRLKTSKLNNNAIKKTAQAYIQQLTTENKINFLDNYEKSTIISLYHIKKEGSIWDDEHWEYIREQTMICFLHDYAIIKCIEYAQNIIDDKKDLSEYLNKPIMWMANKNELVTIFKVLQDAGIIHANNSDVQRLIARNFVDKNNEPFKMSTIQDIYKPSKAKEDFNTFENMRPLIEQLKKIDPNSMERKKSR